MSTSLNSKADKAARNSALFAAKDLIQADQKGTLDLGQVAQILGRHFTSDQRPGSNEAPAVHFTSWRK